MSWSLDARLAADTHHVLSLDLSELLLMDNASVPWLVLVPRRADAVEWIDLDGPDRLRLFEETTRVAGALRAVHRPCKLNIGALGNIVRQLHVHVVARRDDDPAWPGPVWGALPPMPYTAAVLRATLASIREAVAAG